MVHTQRALELQQLASTSHSLLEAQQLSAAAQRYTEQAEAAAHMASLARADADALTAPGPAPVGLSADGPALGPSADAPAAEHAPGSSAAGSTLGLSADSPALGLSADGPVAAAAELQPVTAGIDLPELSLHESAAGCSEFVHSLSAELQAAMQQLIASTGLSLRTASAADSALHDARTQQQTLEQLRRSAPGAGHLSLMPGACKGPIAFQQTLERSSHTPWQIPTLIVPSVPAPASTPRGFTSAPGGSDTAMGAEQGSALGSAESSPSGLQLHLMHQLAGLERSVQRVEQGVSSSKQTRRRLKTAQSGPAPQVICTNDCCCNSACYTVHTGSFLDCALPLLCCSDLTVPNDVFAFSLCCACDLSSLALPCFPCVTLTYPAPLESALYQSALPILPSAGKFCSLGLREHVSRCIMTVRIGFTLLFALMQPS